MAVLAVAMRVVVVMMMVVRHVSTDYAMAPRRLPNHSASASNAA